jgi:hypothetical protein
MKSASNNCATCFAYSDDNVDVNLEDMMVMEAIWRSIQVSGQELFHKMCAVHDLNKTMNADLY